MADETNKTEATDSDNALNLAASDAVVSQEQEVVSDDAVSEETQETTTETEQELTTEDDDGLPTDHNARSELGRKVAAMHRRQDDTDSKLDRMLQLLETQQTTEVEEEDYGAPLTRKEAMDLMDQRETQKAESTKQYEEGYVSTLASLTRDLPEDEYGAVMAEMQNMKYEPSGDAKTDAQINVYKAIAAAAKKQSGSSKTNPIKGDKTRSELGTVTSNKTKQNESALPKLDVHGQSYLDFVARQDGDERASALRKSVEK